MDERALTALEGSIEKWERIVAGTWGDMGSINCPLCREFMQVNGCPDCPVCTKTEKSLCEGSPYTAWDEYTKENRRVFDAESLRLAQAELDFLKSLRPQSPETSA